ncbi:MAG: 3-methyl-2-oxobutanoate hydroxymethyltransferase [Rickettsiales bacterium]|nr:3-methyl-2-oxobutanoate hydroxymethyltransferase [Rickettsiales bacterium]
MTRLTTQHIRTQKHATPLVVLTAYTAPIARVIDPYVDILLVGDSLGMVVYGMPTTRGVTLDMMIAHGRAVVTHSAHALVVVDLPFGSYEASPQQALDHAKRLLAETGAQAVKLEGGQSMETTIRLLVKEGIAVMGHVGLLPQSVTDPSGFRTKGKTPEEARQILEDALAVERAGAFAMVIEATKEEVARQITETVKIPTIGIGASPACDGQVLVIDDVLGFTEHAPKFVKRYADLAHQLRDVAQSYANDVRGHIFPPPKI